MFRIDKDGRRELLASPYWNWGAFYEQIARSFLSREWDGAVFGRREDRAVNYWWGIANGVVGLEWADNLPEGTKVLANTLKEGIKSSTLDPFFRKIVSQDHIIRNDGNRPFTAEEILHMDWLCDNVYGSIPGFDALSEKGQAITRLQGIYRDQIPPNKSFAQI